MDRHGLAATASRAESDYDVQVILAWGATARPKGPVDGTALEPTPPRHDRGSNVAYDARAVPTVVAGPRSCRCVIR